MRTDHEKNALRRPTIIKSKADQKRAKLSSAAASLQWEKSRSKIIAGHFNRSILSNRHISILSCCLGLESQKTGKTANRFIQRNKIVIGFEVGQSKEWLESSKNISDRNCPNNIPIFFFLFAKSPNSIQRTWILDLKKKKSVYCQRLRPLCNVFRKYCINVCAAAEIRSRFSFRQAIPTSGF